MAIKEKAEKHHVVRVEQAQRFPEGLSTVQIEYALEAETNETLKQTIRDSLSTLADHLALERFSEAHLDIVVRAHELFHSPLAEFMTQHYLRAFQQHTEQLTTSLEKAPYSPDITKQFKTMHELLKVKTLEENTFLTQAKQDPLFRENEKGV